MKLKYSLAKNICKYLPPIISQSIRNAIISIKDGEQINQDFEKQSFTGSIFVGNTSDFHAFKMSIHGYFDWRNIVIAKKILEFKKGSIIEVGANIGTETISFCDITKKYNSKVFAFEPLPSNVESLYVNKRKNNLTNMVVFNSLVSNKKGTAFFDVPKGNNSGSGYITSVEGRENVKAFDVVTLDETFSEEVISLICVDVEGFEYQVLKGGETLIKNNRPVLILEVNLNYLEKRGQIKFVDFYNYLLSMDYECYQIEKLGIKKVEFHNIKIQTNKNWVCIPKNESHLA